MAKIITEGAAKPGTGDNPLRRLTAFGQSCWLDDLSRRMMEEGALSRFIAQGIRGVTANPATMAKAITSGSDYQSDVQREAAKGRNPDEIYDALVTADIRRASDLFRAVYEESGGGDGFVSLEVAPRIAYDTSKSVAEARRLWSVVDRPNVFIKIPGTEAGVPAIEELLFEGVNVNITLLFSVDRYEAVANAYLSALERRVMAGRQIHRITSVASFFLSRIDVLVDELLQTQTDDTAGKLRGKIAIANAKLAFQSMKGIFATPRWKSLQAKGARLQRLLWASTSTKDPHYPDLMYVEPLVGRATINTMPEQTIKALLDHGNIVADTIEQHTEEARRVIEELGRIGIRFSELSTRLERQGVQKFEEAFDRTISNIQQTSHAEPVHR